MGFGKLNTKRKHGTRSDRFARYVDKSGGRDACWPWLGGQTKKGYGTFSWSAGKARLAHRAAWELTFHDDPGEMHVCHRCDNPICVNPFHLFLGTNDDNVADRVSKQRSAKLAGETNPRAKLTREDVAAIRASAASGRALARQFGVGRTTIMHILSGRNWPDVSPAS